MILGWDIGGVNTKMARVDAEVVADVRSRPFELQRDPAALPRVLRELCAEAGGSPDQALTCAVTMTAELSQLFRTKREGVSVVIEAVETAFPGSSIHVFTVEGTFISPEAARARPLAVAAANWSATAHAVAAVHRDALLVDVGTTTTDIIPIVGGRVVAAGRTDPERLASGELVYTGAVRTPVEAICGEVPFAGGTAGVSAEGFALAADVHVWRGVLAAVDYSVSPPDGRPVTRELCGERLARVICADCEMLDTTAIEAIAEAVAEAQVARVAAAVVRVAGRHPSLRTAIVTGVGDFIAAAAARAAGLGPIPLADTFGHAGSRCAPATAVALLLAQGRLVA